MICVLSARLRTSVSAAGFELSLNESDEIAADRARKRGACSCSSRPPLSSHLST
jgi:hypothetical protein